MGTEQAGYQGQPCEISPIFSLEDTGISYNILSVHQPKGVHIQFGSAFHHFPEGKYVRINLGNCKLSTDALVKLYRSVVLKLGDMYIHLEDDGDTLVPMESVTVLSIFGHDPVGRSLYMKVEPPTIDDIEALSPTEDGNWWGYPDMRQKGTFTLVPFVIGDGEE